MARFPLSDTSVPVAGCLVDLREREMSNLRVSHFVSVGLDSLSHEPGKG